MPKSSKSYGTCWIDHTFTSMKIMLENYGAYISHVESLSQTDSQALKRAELKGYLLKWKDASIPISLAIYLDVLSPLKRLSLSFQQELHDPVIVSSPLTLGGGGGVFVFKFGQRGGS